MGKSAEYALDHLQYSNGKLIMEDIKEQQSARIVAKLKTFVKHV